MKRQKSMFENIVSESFYEKPRCLPKRCIFSKNRVSKEEYVCWKLSHLLKFVEVNFDLSFCLLIAPFGVHENTSWQLPLSLRSINTCYETRIPRTVYLPKRSLCFIFSTTLFCRKFFWKHLRFLKFWYKIFIASLANSNCRLSSVANKVYNENIIKRFLNQTTNLKFYKEYYQFSWETCVLVGTLFFIYYIFSF